MRHFLKLVCGLLVSAACAGAEDAPSATLIEMRRHMLDPAINSLTFRSMDELFTTFTVAKAGTPTVLDAAPAALDFTYEFDGDTVAAADFGERTYTNALLIMRDDKIVRWWDYWDLATLMNGAPTWWIDHIMNESGTT